MMMVATRTNKSLWTSAQARELSPNFIGSLRSSQFSSLYTIPRHYMCTVFDYIEMVEKGVNCIVL